MSKEKYRKMSLFQMKAIVSVSVKQFCSASESRVKAAYCPKRYVCVRFSFL